MTGPRALTFAEAIAEIAAAGGRPVRYKEMSVTTFADAMREHLPEDVLALLIELFTVVLDGRNVATANGVKEALGRPARDFRDWARDVAATGVWGEAGIEIIGIDALQYCKKPRLAASSLLSNCRNRESDNTRRRSLSVHHKADANPSNDNEEKPRSEPGQNKWREDTPKQIAAINWRKLGIAS